MIAIVLRGTVATYHLANFVPSAYTVFARIQLLICVPPSADDEPGLEEEAETRLGGYPFSVVTWQARQEGI
ncbi:hypothetical protein JCGZ_10411 [Jatropha curcas]|uniref:Uncharacterized protein n=1 Tax=Jatropha curcas TaxID=180498 RepID=A0A067KU41_JATCU|nr:hypothetical protein JCGZ_18624 [Jatropha curcas]KDP35775.1 hypothetical protein JCGZ_10411 [Jatropha curcas]